MAAEPPADAVARATFVVTMISTALFAGSVFLFIL